MSTMHVETSDGFRRELDGWRLARYGEPVRWTSDCVSLAGRGWVWLVASGELAPGDAARPVHGIVWIRVLSGRVGELGTGAVAAIDDAVWSASGAVLAVGTTADLLAGGSLWRLLAGEELRLRYALDRRLAP